jgi:hypothetical protein
MRALADLVCRRFYVQERNIVDVFFDTPPGAVFQF